MSDHLNDNWIGMPDEYEQGNYLREAMVEAGIEMELYDGLVNYILYGRPTGHFLKAVLDNDLLEACKRADMKNRRKLYNVVQFLVCCAPSTAWGDSHKTASWMRGLGQLGRRGPIREAGV